MGFWMTNLTCVDDMIARKNNLSDLFILSPKLGVAERLLSARRDCTAPVMYAWDNKRKLDQAQMIKKPKWGTVPHLEGSYYFYLMQYANDVLVLGSGSTVQYVLYRIIKYCKMANHPSDLLSPTGTGFFG